MCDVYPGKRFQLGRCPELRPTRKEYINTGRCRQSVESIAGPLTGAAGPQQESQLGKTLGWRCSEGKEKVVTARLASNDCSIHLRNTHPWAVQVMPQNSSRNPKFV